MMMRRRALYRSVWFWLGWFVLGFLVWVWVDSWWVRTHAFSSRVVGEDTGGGGFNANIGLVDGVLIDSGCVVLNWSRVTIVDPGKVVRPIFKRWLREPTEPGNKWFPRPAVMSEVYDDVPGYTVVRYQVEVPMWGVVGFYLAVVWGGVMVWRGRRVMLDQKMEEGVTE